MIYPSSQNLVALFCLLATSVLGYENTINTSYPSNRFVSNGQMAAMVGL